MLRHPTLTAAVFAAVSLLAAPARAQETFCNDVDSVTLWCPCQQPPLAGAVDGCANSCTSGGLLELVSSSPLRLRMTRTCRSTMAVLLRSAEKPGLPALGGNGLRCLRFFSISTVGAQGTVAGSAEWALPPQPPGTHYYQAWHRDAPGHCLGNASNMTNGVVVP